MYSINSQLFRPSLHVTAGWRGMLFHCWRWFRWRHWFFAVESLPCAADQYGGSGNDTGRNHPIIFGFIASLARFLVILVFSTATRDLLKALARQILLIYGGILLFFPDIFPPRISIFDP